MPTTRATAKTAAAAKTGRVDVITQGGKDRRLQAVFVAAFILPQLAVLASSTDHSAYIELFELFRPAAELRMRLLTQTTRVS
jgi:hypothetical protein